MLCTYKDHSDTYKDCELTTVSVKPFIFQKL